MLSISKFPTKKNQYASPFSQGYKLYQALKLIKDHGNDGARFTDITALLYKMNYPHIKKTRENRGWGTGYFSPKWRSPIGKRAEKNDKGRWVLNSEGESYLRNNKHFEDGKDWTP